MNPGAANTDNFFNFKINHDVAVTGYPTRIWRATKKYSVNNTLPIVAVNAWLQFSLAYIAAVIVTSHDMSFIANILNSRAMPAYALASVILGTILLTSLVIKHVHKQEIKDEILKNGKNTIDIKIRGGESDGINEIAQNALTIEIVPDTSFIGDKKENFSIVLPISGKQGEILENKRQENRNKIVLLTVPYVLSGLTIVGALAKFGFANIQSWKQWTFIAAVGVIAIVGACVTLSKLRNNEVDNACNTVRRFDNADILLPCRKGSVVSVMENKFESKEENDPVSRLIKLLDGHFTEFTDKISDLFDKFLVEAKTSIDERFLEPVSEKIRETLNHLKEIREDIKKDLDWLHAEISEVLSNTKELTKKVNSLNIESTFSNLESAIETAKDKIEQFEPNWLLGKFQPAKRSDNNKFLNMLEKLKDDIEKEKTEWQEQLKKINDELKELKGKQTQPSVPDSGAKNGNNTNKLSELEDKVKELRDTVRKLELEAEQNKLQQKKEKLEQKKSEQEKTDERQEKINGKPSKFLYYVLESIKLEEKGDKEKDSKVEATLRNFNNKIIIHWKDGSQTICHIKKQGDLPSTEVDFVDKNIQAAFEAACVG